LFADLSRVVSRGYRGLNQKTILMSIFVHAHDLFVFLSVLLVSVLDQTNQSQSLLMTNILVHTPFGDVDVRSFISGVSLSDEVA